MKKNKVNATLALFVTVAFLFQFLIFGVKPIKYSAEEYRPSTAISFTLKQNEEKQYLISSLDELNAFSRSVNSGETTINKTFVVTSPIEINSSFVSIGTAAYPFKGTFDGGGYNCSLTRLNKPLFYKTQGATIKNVEVASGTINSSSTYVGAIVAYASDTSIEQCRNMASVSNDSTRGTIYTGGIVGFSSGGSISQCSNLANVSNSSSLVAASYVGGIMGYGSYTYVNNCYCLGGNESSKLTITARAQKNTSNFIARKKGDSLYYSMLESVNEKAQKALEDAKNVLKSKQDEGNAIRAEINRAKAWIKSQENYIAQLTREANNSFCGWKWSYIGPQIGGIYVAIGARWTEIGALEASLKVAEGAIWVAQQAVNVALKLASSTVYDMQWVNPYQDCTKTLESVMAYAYGIGFSNTSLYNSYTANISIVGGYEKTTYKYYLEFWAQSARQDLILSSDEITRKLEFYNNDRFGLISNSNGNNCFFLDNLSYDRSITVDNNKNFDYYETKHDTILSFGKQKLIFENQNNNVTIFVANRYGSAKTVLDSFTFDTELSKIQGVSCNGQKSTLTDNIKNNFSSSIWGYDSSIEKGYPHLKYRYWQYGAE